MKKYRMKRLYLLVLLCIAGCVSTAVRRRAPYFGPTESMQQVVDAIDKNNQQISTLWARIKYFEADVREKRGAKSQFVNGEGGYLLMQRPQDIRLRANKAGVGIVLDVGANDLDLWLVAPPANRAWWLERKNADKPCTEKMPIDPVAVLEVLGVGVVDKDFLHSPTPVMRFNNDQDAYMLIWHSRSQSGTPRWIARREIWYDRKTKLPELVNLFDENGRVIVRAYLSDDRVVEGTTAEMASKFQLFFPDSDSHFSFSLEEMKLTNGRAPNRLSFLFNPDRTGVSDVERMDGECK
ncbi:MAG TPA: hypothetical protein VG722_07490 [Tepidisphaeraceae bacterium]|nr:hypothetical protein [Tepidisphaeraceae bacterium]